MKISEYIIELEKLKEKHGDLEVYKDNIIGLRIADVPKFRQLSELKPRESKERYLNSWDKDRKPIKDVIDI